MGTGNDKTEVKSKKCEHRWLSIGRMYKKKSEKEEVGYEERH